MPRWQVSRGQPGDNALLDRDTGLCHQAHRKLINELAARYWLPVIHALPTAAADGGLISHGLDLPNVFRQTTRYTDRILKGANPGDLPIYLPTKFELVINLTTSKALGIDVPLVSDAAR